MANRTSRFFGDNKNAQEPGGVPVVIWLDLLCWPSLFKLVRSLDLFGADAVYYFNATAFGSLLAVPLQRICKTRIIQIEGIDFRQPNETGTPIYLSANERLYAFANIVMERDDVRRAIDTFAKISGCSEKRIKRQIEDELYYHAIRPIEMYEISCRHLDGKNATNLFMLIGSPLAGDLASFFGAQVLTYRKPTLPPRVNLRKNYYLDEQVLGKYFSCTGHAWLFLVGLFLNHILGAIAARLFGFSMFEVSNQPRQEDTGTNIGVLYNANGYWPQERNEIYWYPKSGIAAESVYIFVNEAFEFSRAGDFPGSDFSIVFLSQGLKSVWRLRNRVTRDTPVHLYHPPERILFKAWSRALRTLANRRISSPLSGWLGYQLALLSMRVEILEHVYGYFGLGLCFGTANIDVEKVARAQAMANLGGFTIGTHYSFYPSVAANVKRADDIIITWGDYFRRNCFNGYEHEAIFCSGYPADFTFSLATIPPQLEGNHHPSKFFIGFFDQPWFDDAYSPVATNREVWDVTKRILAQHSGIEILLKPKSRTTLRNLIEQFPDVAELISTGRIHVIEPDPKSNRMMPVNAGRACDLVVGVALSTAVMECQLAGIPGFHFDGLPFIGNEFAEMDRGSMVFREPKVLEQAIEAFIEKRKSGVRLDYELPTMIDPFQDGHAFKRTGWIIHALQVALRDSKSRQEVIDGVLDAYEVMLNDTAAEHLDREVGAS